MMPFIGVDIGNSGFRASRLDVANDEITPILRLRWKFPDQGTSSSASQASEDCLRH